MALDPAAQVIGKYQCSPPAFYRPELTNINCMVKGWCGRFALQSRLR